MSNRPFFGGVPYDVEVRALIAAFGVPQEGSLIAHDEVEAACGLSRKQTRYRGVIYAWRKRLLAEHNVQLGSVIGQGFKCLAPAERISSSVDGIQSGVRKQLRAVRLSDRVVTDDPVLLKQQDVLHRYGNALRSDATRALAEIAPTQVQRQLPRVLPKQVGDGA